MSVIADMRRQGYRMAVIFVGDSPPPPMPEGVALHDLRAFFEDLELGFEFKPA